MTDALIAVAETQAYPVGSRVLVCGKDAGTITQALKSPYTGRIAYDVKFDDRPYSRTPGQTAVGVIEENLSPEVTR